MDIIHKEISAYDGIHKVSIYGLRVGRLAIKASAMNSKRPGTLSTLLSFTDKNFGEWLPVWVWLIVHPEGTFLVDTGLSADVIRAGYFRDLDLVSRYYFEKQMKFEISREKELDHMLKKIGFKTSQIDKVILTHLHIDHTGGLKHISEIPIMVNEIEWQTKDGSFPKLFPPNINIKKISLQDSFQSFKKAHYITEGKDLIMIHTPGHTRGHVSIALLDSEHEIYLFGGDVSYTQKRLYDKVFSATIKNHKDNKESCEKVIELSKKYKLILLPTHDSNNISRLNGEV